VNLPPGVRVDAASPGGGGQQNEPTGVVSLVLGLLSVLFVFCCAVFTFLFSVAGVVTGILSLVRIHSEPDRFRGRGIAIAGISVSLLGPVLYVLLWLFAGALTLVPALFGP